MVVLIAVGRTAGAYGQSQTRCPEPPQRKRNLFSRRLFSCDIYPFGSLFLVRALAVSAPVPTVAAGVRRYHHAIPVGIYYGYYGWPGALVLLFRPSPVSGLELIRGFKVGHDQFYFL